MFQTPIGPHDGDSWEELCQACLKIKYSGRYVAVPASPGDYGLDGFCVDGMFFQCYCPEKEYTTREVYEKQRQKITDDIPKLKDYEKKIEAIVNGVKIKYWYLLTPIYQDNDLLAHCAKKESLVKSYNLSFIDKDFKILPLDYQYLLEELPAALRGLEYTTTPTDIIKKINIDGGQITTADLKMFSEDTKNLEPTQNAFRKLATRFPNDGKDYTDRINKQVNAHVEHLLVGDKMLKEWETLFQDQLDNFIKVMGTLESKVSLLCDIPSKNNDERYTQIIALTQKTIDEEFSHLSKFTRDKLVLRVVSDWLLRCPLNLE